MVKILKILILLSNLDKLFCGILGFGNESFKITMIGLTFWRLYCSKNTCL